MGVWLVDVKMIKIKSLFIILFIFAFLPLALACGDEQAGNNIGNSASVNANAVYGNAMMSGSYSIGLFIPLIMILVIISLVLFIIWMIKNLKRNKK